MNKVVHFEIPFDDKQRAMRFYGEAFGWQLSEFPKMNYVVARTTEVDNEQVPTTPGAINGGLFASVRRKRHRRPSMWRSRR